MYYLGCAVKKINNINALHVDPTNEYNGPTVNSNYLNQTYKIGINL